MILLGREVFPLASPTILISTYLHLIFRQTQLGINNAAFLRHLLYFPFFTQTASCFERPLGIVSKGGQRPLEPPCTEFPLQHLPRAACPFLKVRLGLRSEGGREMPQIPAMKPMCPLAVFDMCVSTERLVANLSLCIPTTVKRYFHQMASRVHNPKER